MRPAKVGRMNGTNQKKRIYRLPRGPPRDRQSQGANERGVVCYFPDLATLRRLELLLEGMSMRSIERITGLHQRTIINLMLLAGERCEKLMRERIQGIAVKDVEADDLGLRRL
jgi:hypothetical protein